MSEPDFSHAALDIHKRVDYLLASTHPGGKSKARYFTQMGFTRDDLKLLRALCKRMRARTEWRSSKKRLSVSSTLSMARLKRHPRHAGQSAQSGSLRQNIRHQGW